MVSQMSSETCSEMIHRITDSDNLNTLADSNRRVEFNRADAKSPPKRGGDGAGIVSRGQNDNIIFRADTALVVLI
jgi:hypothetical protein